MPTNYLDVGAQLLSKDVGAYEIQTGGSSSYTLTANLGTYSVSGQAAVLNISRSVSITTGAYTVSGQAATFIAGKILPANTGAYVVTGNSTSFTVSRRLAAVTGTYAVSGQNTTLTKTASGLTLVAETGAYSVSGKNVQFSSALSIRAVTGTYIVSGKQADLVLSSSVVVGGKNLKGELFKPKETADTYPKRYPDAREKEIKKAAYVLSKAGGHARAESLSSAQRVKIAKHAANTRWK